MASHVVVMSSAARSTKVKVTPSTYMSDVLDQARKALKLEPGNYLLKSVPPSEHVGQDFQQAWD